MCFEGGEYFPVPVPKGTYSRAPRRDLSHILPEGRADEYKVGWRFSDFLKKNSGKKAKKAPLRKVGYINFSGFTKEPWLETCQKGFLIDKPTIGIETN
jgi:hypothetical protein